MTEVELINFKDILRERRSGSDFMWATQSWVPTRAYNQLLKSNPDAIKVIVYSSQKLSSVIEQLSDERGVSKDVLYKEVVDILNEMSYARVVPVLRWLGFFTSKILKRLFSGLLVNEKKVLEIKSQFGSNPVLLVPSHRSYGDFILMSFLCFHYVVDIPRIAAGMDFHSMAFMGRVLRSACAFFMRRSFTNDKLYAATFSEYVQSLVKDGDAAVEFFIEGTRSRTAKSLVPKYGFLRMSLTPFLTGLVPDITLIPVNLNYDRVLEELLFVYELLGVPKPKESTKGFLKSWSIRNESYGNVYVHFGEPISAWDYFHDRVDRTIHGVGPAPLQDLTPDEAQQVVRLAHRIVHVQQGLTVLTCFNLVALALVHRIATSPHPMTVTEMVEWVTWLASVVRSLGATVALGSNVHRDVVLGLNLHKNVVRVTSEKRIKLLRTHSGMGDDQARTKGHRLASQTMDSAVPLLLVQYYANPCAHFVANLSFVILIVERRVKSGTIPEVDVRAGFEFLRRVFWNEFAFDSETEDHDFKAALDFARINKAFAPSDNNQLTSLGVVFCKPYVSSYLIGMEVMLKKSTEPSLTESVIHKSYQETVEGLMRAAAPHVHPAMLSLDLISNAVQACVRLGGARKIRRKEKTVYEVDPVRLEEIRNELKTYDAAEAETARGVDLSQHFVNFASGKL